MIDKEQVRNLSFDEIYLIYYPKLVRFCKEYILSEPDAENIVQDCFLYIWERKDTLKSIDNINAFLFRLVKNKCIDHLRHRVTVEAKKEEIRSTYLKEFEFKLLAISSFDDSLSDEEIETIIYNAISRLPDKCREIFILSKLKGMKYEEIASHLELSPNTVRNQIAIALQKMRKELKDYLPLLLFIIG